MAIISSISAALERAGFSLSDYQDSVPSIAIAVAIVATTYYVYTNVLELNKPKGYRSIPKLNSWNTIYYMLKTLPSKEKYIHTTKDALEKYGIARVTQLGKEIVHIGDPEYANQVLMNLDTFPKFNMSESQSGSPRSRFVGYNVVHSNGEIWRRHRKACNPAFHRSWSTDAFGERTDAMIDKILSHIKEGAPAVDVGDLSRRVTLDALAKIAFDYDFRSIEDPSATFATIYHKVVLGFTDPLYAMLPFLDNTTLFRRVKTHKATEEFANLLVSIIEAKREKIRLAEESGMGCDDDDLLSFLIRASGEESLTDEDLRSNMFVFFVAGHDTTANSLACALGYIANNPELQDRLYAEVSAVLGPSDVTNGTPIPTADEVKNMELINAVIKETMRINPSVELIPPRIVAKETTFGPYTVPVGTQINVNIYSIQNNAKYWDHPDVFDPDRFMGVPAANKGGAKGGKKEASAWIPFSAGSRVCIGMNFSLIEQRVVLSMILHRFKLSLPEDSIHKKEIQFVPMFLKAPKDLYVQFTPRY